jgi:hypothetical protein
MAAKVQIERIMTNSKVALIGKKLKIGLRLIYALL